MRRFRNWVLVGLALLMVAVLGPLVLAQSSTGVVTGTVKDASGAIVPGVEVTITDTATNSRRVVVSEDNGRFRLTSVDAGTYRAEAKLAGFKTSVTTFKLDVAGVATLNFVLQVGEVSTVAEVTDIAQKVNTEEGTLSSVVNERQVKELPLNGRNVFQLALLQPGVTQGISDGIGGQSGINASGNRTRGNNFSLDGAGNNDPITGGATQITPNLDTIAEFRIQNNNFSAEFGRDNGAVINVITKSGTNQFHGTAYWFHRNDALDAREIFDGDDIAPLRQHQAGFTIGGPVIKDKTFFFFGFEAFRSFTGESAVSAFETQAFRDQVHAAFPGSIQDTLFQAFPGPAPQTELVDVGSISNQFLAPGPPDGIADRGLVSAFAPTVTKNYQYNVRVDHEIGQNDKFYGRYTWEDQSTPGNDLRSQVFATDFEGFAAQGVLPEPHIFSPTVVNEFRYGYSRSTSDFVSDTQYTDIDIDNNIGSDGISGFGAYGGVPQYFTGEEYNLVDVVSINRGNHGFKVGFEYRWNQDDSDFQFLTNGYVYYAGMFDFAANLPYYEGFRVDPRQTSGTPQLVGTPHNFRQQESGFFVQDDWKVSDRLTLNLGIRYDNYGLLKDTQDRLANIILGPGSDVFERVQNATVGQVPPEGIFARDNNNWAPRLGFAWDIFGNGKTSLRGGFGVAYDRLFLNVSGNVRFNPPFSANLGLLPNALRGDLGLSAEAISRLIATGVQIPFRVPTGLVSAGFNPGGGPLLEFTVPGQGASELGGRITLRSPDPSLKTSYSMNWFLGIQRELPWDMVFEVNYVGNGGRKLGFIEQYNRFSGDRFGYPNPYTGEHDGDTGINYLSPWFSSENLRSNNVNSLYHGGNVSIQKRFSQGLTFQSAFTFGKVLDYASDNFGSNAGDIFSSNPGRLDLERGLASFDIPKRWVTNFIYEIPFLKDQQGVLGEVLGGWQIQGILTLQNGSPYTVQAYSSSHDYNGDGRNNDRPDAPADASVYNGLGRQQYINGVFGSTSSAARSVFNPNGLPCDRGGTRTSCRGLGLPIGIGTEGRSLFRGPGYANADFSLFKNFRLPWVGQEDSKLQFRAEFFNVFNRPNLNNVNRSFLSGTFGRSTSAQDAREIQFALKFIF